MKMPEHKRRLMVKLLYWLAFIFTALFTWWSLKHGGTGGYSGP
jgi:TRAP-type C4-dicarboxylate transport system permease small subunit